MREKGLDQTAFAALVGHKPSWASMFFAGEREMPLSTIEELARALKVDPLTLFQEPQAPAASLDGYATVPLLRTPIAAGKPLVVEPDPESDHHLSFSAGLVRKYPGAVCIKVGPREESMLPTIQPGDTVLIDRSEGVRRHPHSGTVYAVNYARLNGDPGSAVKRIEVAGDVLVVSSDNPDKRNYPTLTARLTGVDLLQVLIGQVVWHGRYLTPRKS